MLTHATNAESEASLFGKAGELASAELARVSSLPQMPEGLRSRWEGITATLGVSSAELAVLAEEAIDAAPEIGETVNVIDFGMAKVAELAAAALTKEVEVSGMDELLNEFLVNANAKRDALNLMTTLNELAEAKWEALRVHQKMTTKEEELYETRVTGKPSLLERMKRIVAGKTPQQAAWDRVAAEVRATADAKVMALEAKTKALKELEAKTKALKEVEAKAKALKANEELRRARLALDRLKNTMTTVADAVMIEAMLTGRRR